MQTSENIIEANATACRLRTIADKGGGLAPFELPFIADLIERLALDSAMRDGLLEGIVSRENV